MQQGGRGLVALAAAVRREREITAGICNAVSQHQGSDRGLTGRVLASDVGSGSGSAAHTAQRDALPRGEGLDGPAQAVGGGAANVGTWDVCCSIRHLVACVRMCGVFRVVAQSTTPIIATVASH